MKDVTFRVENNNGNLQVNVLSGDVKETSSNGTNVSITVENAPIFTLTKRDKDTKTLGILSIIFGALGGVVGLILGIICVTRDKNGPYAKLGYIGIALSSVFMLLNIATSILNIVNH